MLGLRCNGVAFNCLVNFSAFLFGRRLSNCFGMQTKAAEASAVEEKIAAIERKINSNRRRSDNTNVFDSKKWTNAVNIHVNQINFLVDAGRYFISACERVRCSCVFERSNVHVFLQCNAMQHICIRLPPVFWIPMTAFSFILCSLVFLSLCTMHMYHVQNVSR